MTRLRVARFAAPLLGTACLLRPAEARAQGAPAPPPPAAAAHARDEGGITGFPRALGASFLAPELLVPLGRVRVSFRGLAVSRDGGAPGLGAELGASVLVAPALGLSAAARHARYGALAAEDDPLRGSSTEVEVRRSAGRFEAWASWTELRPQGAWVEGAADRAGGGVAWSPGWLRLALTVDRTRFEDSVTVRADTIIEVAGYPFRSPRTRSVVSDLRYVDAEAASDVALGVGRIGVVVGVRGPGDRVGGDVWGRVRAALTLPVDGLVVEGSIGIRPSQPERALAKARFASLGVRWTPGARRPAGGEDGGAMAPSRVRDAPVVEMAKLADGTPALRLRNLAADSVAFMGDVTDWTAVPLAPWGPGAWMLRGALSPGTYAYLLSVDGGPWHVPSGLPSIPGEYGGTVGLLVVEGTP